MEKNSVKINIAGVDYSLRTDESVELTMELAKEKVGGLSCAGR